MIMCRNVFIINQRELHITPQDDVGGSYATVCEILVQEMDTYPDSNGTKLKVHKIV